MKLISLGKNKFAIVDDEDFEKINSFKWHHGARQYAIRNPGIYMHKYIIGAESGQKVDHINGDSLDNRKSNLRLCTQQQNLCNRSKKKKSKTGFKGVYKDKYRGLWAAEISYRGKKKYLGRFKTPDDAAKAYDDAAKKIHGEFARLNFDNR